MRKFSKTALAAAIILLCVVLSACRGGRGERVIIAGSTSVQPYMEILVEEYGHIDPGAEIDVQGGGTSTGISAVESGTADIGMSSRALAPGELELNKIELAKDGLAIIVHPENPVDELTLAQARSIYTAEISNWRDLGGPDARIHIVSREEGSGTRSAFEGLIMKDERITPKAIVQDSNGAVRQLISGDRNAIGFISMGLTDPTVKALRIDGAAPTCVNIENGTYRLYRPFLLVTNGAPEGLAAEFITYALSKAGQDLLEIEGLIPASEGGRK